MIACTTRPGDRSPRRRIVIALVVAPLLAACGAATTAPTVVPTATPATTAPTVAPSPAAPPTNAPTTAPTPKPSAGPPVPWALPIKEYIAIDGTTVLGLDASNRPVLHDLETGSVTVLDIGPEARLRGFSARAIVGAVPSANGKRNLPLVLERGSGSPVDLGLGDAVDGWAKAADGALVVGSVIGDRAVFIHDLGTGRTRRLDFLDGEDRIGIAALDGSRMAGTFGPWDGEQAWAYDLATDTEVDLHGLLDGSNSWARDVDGDLVVGAVETPRTWEHRAFVFDFATGAVTELAVALGANSDAAGVDDARVVGTVMEATDRYRAFVHDLRTGITMLLPGLPGSDGSPSAADTEAMGIDGRFVVGRSGSTIVAWDMALRP